MKTQLKTLFILFFCLSSMTLLSQQLDVDGTGIFNLPNGSIAMSTPGGWPGIIGINTVNNQRRDIAFRELGISLLAGSTTNAPGNNEGVWIREGGNTGIGIWNPSSRLHVYGGNARFEPNMGTPGAFAEFSTINGGFPQMYLYTGSVYTVALRSNGPSFLNGGHVGVGTPDPTSKLHVVGDSNTVRIEGPNTYGHDGSINFGDANYVYIQESEDDHLEVFALDGVTIKSQYGVTVDGGFGGVQIKGTGYKKVNPCELKASSNSQIYASTAYGAWGVNFDPEFYHLNAPVYLPEGVEVTGVFLWYNDTEASAELAVSFIRTNTSTGIDQTISTLVSSGSGGDGTDSDFPSGWNIIDNQTYHYTVIVKTTSNSNWTNTLQFKGLQFTYE